MFILNLLDDLVAVNVLDIEPIVYQLTA